MGVIRIDKLIFLLFSCALGTVVNCNAQFSARAYADAEDFLYSGKFQEAMAAYSYARDHPTYIFKTTICATMMGTAYKGLESYLSFEGSMGGYYEFQYWLGKIYLKHAEYFNAKKAFSAFLSINQDVHTPTNRNSEKMVQEAKSLLGYLSHVDESLIIENEESFINSKYSDFSVAISDDQNHLLFVSDRTEDNLYLVYHSTRSAHGWGSPTEVSGLSYYVVPQIAITAGKGSSFFLNNPTDQNLINISITGHSVVLNKPLKPDNMQGVHHFCINENQTKIIFSKETPTNGLDLYETLFLRTSGQWTDPAPILGMVNSPYDEDFPFISEDRSKLYFSSERPEGLGKRDIYVAEIDRKTYQWGSPTNVGLPLNSIDDDIDFRLYSVNQGYLISDRWGTTGKLDLFILSEKNLLSQGK